MHATRRQGDPISKRYTSTGVPKPACKERISFPMAPFDFRATSERPPTAFTRGWVTRESGSVPLYPRAPRARPRALHGHLSEEPKRPGQSLSHQEHTRSRESGTATESLGGLRYPLETTEEGARCAAATGANQGRSRDRLAAVDGPAGGRKSAGKAGQEHERTRRVGSTLQSAGEGPLRNGAAFPRPRRRHPRCEFHSTFPARH